MRRDFLAAVTLATQALLLPMLIVIGSRLGGVRRAVVLAIAGGWLLLLAALSAAGFLRLAGMAHLSSALRSRHLS
jgi:hypothetical protein